MQTTMTQLAADAGNLLRRWLPAARTLLHPVADDPALAFYSTGGHEHWAAQAQATALAALASAGAEAEALALLRYFLRTHKAGDRLCVSGENWGNTWIGALALERMAHAIPVLQARLTADDQALLRRVMLSEADYVLDNWEVKAQIDATTGGNHPESNLWCGIILYRTALLYPEAPRADAYRSQATRLMLNGICVPDDARSAKLFNGRAEAEWVVGANFTDNYGLHHHGYLNVGYMVICLSNIAMAHYFCRQHRLPAPPELYHHVPELWQQVKTCCFADGRLWRIGGDTRFRYCYCQDYLLPVLILMADHYGDQDAATMAAGWIGQVETEQSQSPDGAFLGVRLAELRHASPLYYARLEGDRAVTLSMAVEFLRPAGASTGGGAPAAAPASGTQPVLNAWQDDFHRAVLVRGKRRLASWTGRAAQGPCGMFLPADASSLAEWRWNLAGCIAGTGCDCGAIETATQITRLDGGFAVLCAYDWYKAQDPAEGTRDTTTAAMQTLFAVLPDETTAVVLQYATAPRPVYINLVEGLRLAIPNDLFNGSQRLYLRRGSWQPFTGAGTTLPPEASLDWGPEFGVDHQLFARALYGADGFTLYRPGCRNTPLVSHKPLAASRKAGGLYCDLLLLHQERTQHFHAAGAVLLDIGAVLSLDPLSAAKPEMVIAGSSRQVTLRGADGRTYRVKADFAVGSHALERLD